MTELAGIYASEYRNLVCLASIVCDDPEVGEEIVQQAFVSALVHWKRIREVLRAPSYLRARVLDEARRRSVGPRVAEAATDPQPVLAPDGSVVDRALVLSALRRLPDRQKDCLILRHLLDLTHAGIAETLGISVGSVKADLRSGMVNLVQRQQLNESDLSRALKSHADEVVDRAPAWEEVERMAEAAIDERRRRRALFGRLSAAAVLLVVLLIAAGVSRNDGRHLRAAGDPGPVVEPASSTSTTAFTERGYAGGDVGIWPLASKPDYELYRQSGSTEYSTPEGTARSFLSVYAGMPDATLGEFEPGPTNEGRKTGHLGAGFSGQLGLPMTMALAQVAVDGPWTVTGVTCESIVVTSPAAGATVTSPIALAGQAQAFEGVVRVEVRRDGHVAGQNAGVTQVMGRGDALGSFSGSITFGTTGPAGGPGGAVVFMEMSAKDGRPVRLAVVRVHLSP